jgi:hypothetical protein
MAVPGEGDRHAIDYHEAAGLMGVSASTLRNARRKGELATAYILRRGELLPVLRRGEVEALANLDVVGASVLGRDTYIPRYAVAQLAAGGIVEAVSHPFVRQHHGLRIERHSVQSLIDRLEQASTDVGPESLSLASAMSVVGGREKPYLGVFRALLDGRLPFAFAGGGACLTRRIRIGRASLPLIRAMGDEHCGCYDRYTLDEARNILNLHARDADALSRYRSGTKRSAALFDRKIVNSLAERYISLGEAAVRTGRHSRTIMGVLNRAGVLSGRLGWDRAGTETALGIAPCTDLRVTRNQDAEHECEESQIRHRAV